MSGAWADVPVDQYGQITCPIPRCGAGLYLNRSYSIPLYAEAEWTYDAGDAVTDGWTIECTDGHLLRDSTDQARETEDADETADNALPYDHRATHAALNELAGGHRDPRHHQRRPNPPTEPTMSNLTSDPNDPRLTRGTDSDPTPQAEAYLVLSEDERAKGFVRPLRRTYVHTDGCGVATTMSEALSQTYARQPTFYGATYCVGCRMHRPVSEFRWDIDGQVVGS